MIESGTTGICTGRKRPKTRVLGTLFAVNSALSQEAGGAVLLGQPSVSAKGSGWIWLKASSTKARNQPPTDSQGFDSNLLWSEEILETQTPRVNIPEAPCQNLVH